MNDVLTMPSWRKYKAPVALAFEIIIYDDEANEIERRTERMRSETSAKSKAGRIAKRSQGPVDLAYAGDAEWADRYITTAMPSEFNKSGFRFERLQ